ncbi:MAG: DnaB-like helicase N-terminal domain-containing protein, partial [Actinomycetota bacterium]
MADVADIDGRRNDPRRVVRTDSRVPPHNLDAEASLLGAMLLDEEPIGIAIERGLEAEDFYKPAHGHVYAAIRVLAAAAQAVDVVTVSEELRRSKQLDELGGLNFLVELQNSTPSVSSAGRYVQIVRDTAILRRLIKGAADIAEIGFSSPADVSIAIDQAEQIIFDIGEDQITDSLKKLNELTGTVTSILEARFDSGSDITGVRTG